MLNRIALGTVQFGLDYGIANERGRIPGEEVQKILKLAIEKNITTIDTAQVYGDSESVVGNALLSENKDKYEIITKISPENLDAVHSSVVKSIKNLNTHRLYGLLYHDFNSYVNNTDSLNHLKELQAENKVQKIGFSLYYPEQLEQLFEKNVEFEIIQIPYNIFDRRFERLFEETKRRNIEIHIRSVFLQGIVFMKADKLNTFFNPIKDKLQKLNETAADFKIPVSALSMHFCLLNENIDKVVIGVDSFSNFKSNLSDINNCQVNQGVMNILKSLQIDDEKFVLPFNWEV